MATALAADAAELRASVEINSDKVQPAQPELFGQLKTMIEEYLNTTSFTTGQYSPAERIECRFFFTIDSYNADQATGTLQVQSSRPVFDSSYTTTLLNFRDTEVTFPFDRGLRLNFNENAEESPLNALLDFYAYLIIALDLDSFSERGGDEAYTAAQRVAQLARAGNEKGWRALDNPRNRASLLGAFTSGPSADYRKVLYSYHRLGLDRMSMAPDKGRAEITAAITKMADIAKAVPMSAVLPAFRDAKLDELAGIYSKAPDDERRRVAETLLAIYPTERQRIEPISGRK